MDLSRICLSALVFFSVAIVPIQGIDLSISEGNSNGGLAVSTYYGATIKDEVKNNLKFNPAEGTMSNHWYFTGPGARTVTAYGYGGAKAQSYFSITGPYAQTWYEFGAAGYPARTSESLTSRSAHEIYTWSQATNSEGDIAKGKFDVHAAYGWNNAYINNYRNTAYATSTYAGTSQAADSAGATYGTISTQEYAKDYLDNSYVTAQFNGPLYYAYNGYNYGFYGKAEASRYADYTRTWDYLYAYGYPNYLRAFAYQSYGPQSWYDPDNWYYTHGIKQWSSTGATSGTAYNSHII